MEAPTTPRPIEFEPSALLPAGRRTRRHRRVARGWVLRCTALLLASLLGAGCSDAPSSGGAEATIGAETEPLVLYLVRHAEREEDGTRDPAISEAGRERAELLATMLADAGIERVHATPFRRTVQTAAPMAMSLGLDEVEGYDDGDLAAFSARLRGAGGRHLIVGHSNTTRILIEVLGGEPGPPIEEFEYDRLYIITMIGEEVVTVLLRYGAPFR